MPLHCLLNRLRDFLHRLRNLLIFGFNNKKWFYFLFHLNNRVEVNELLVWFAEFSFINFDFHLLKRYIVITFLHWGPGLDCWDWRSFCDLFQARNFGVGFQFFSKNGRVLGLLLLQLLHLKEFLLLLILFICFYLACLNLKNFVHIKLRNDAPSL